MHVVHALALRRVALTATGLAATLGAHALTAGDLRIAATAPVLWATLLLAAAMCGGRRALRPRSYAALAVMLAGAQTLMHLVLVVAPWSLGLAPHHHALPPVDARSAALHLVAALVLAVLLRRADLVLAAITTAAAVVGRVLATPTADRPGRRPPERVAAWVAAHRGTTPRRPRTSRGPPCAVSPARPAVAPTR
ncbi:hypothetical protein [Miltoncostaea oceani]|uniref:hypothetical protein n=1 Tax=Miltoncostaea oceani TaxID=2843216 RepID=UPI001C3D1926|nr:hypothetical protein [Miltoncostaea oceani]